MVSNLFAPKAAVIIPHYNDLERLSLCLEHLAPQVAVHQEVEILVVDNASPVSLAPVLATFPWIRLVVEPEKGAAAARNRGVTETTAPYLFFLDSDCVPGPAWVGTALTLAGQADVIGGQVTTFDETPAPRSGAEAFEAIFAFDQKVYIEEKGFSVTANLLTRRDVFEATGPFVVGRSEDLDWCQRATAKGFGLSYAPELEVAHPTRSDWPALRRKWLRLTQEAFGLLADQGEQPTRKARIRWALRALAVLGSAAAHTPKLLKAPMLASWQERSAGMATLWRLRAQRTAWMFRQSLGGQIR